MVKVSSARIDLENARIHNAMLKNYAETLVGGTSGTNTGSAYTIDLSSGNVFHLILNADCTFTFSNPTASGTACGFTLLLKQDGTGGRQAIWPFTVAWQGDTPPTPQTTASKWHLYYFLTLNGGSQWFGFYPNGEFS